MAEFRPFPGLRPKNPEDKDSLAQDGDSFYLLRQETAHGIRTAIIGALKAEKYSAGNAIQMDGASLKERNAASKAIRDAGFQSEPVVCISEPLGEFLADLEGEEMEGTCLRRMSDPDQTKRVAEILGSKRFIVASGAANYESAMEAGSFVLAALIPSDDPGLNIRAAHRFLDTGSISEKNAIKGISKSMALTETSVNEMEKGLPDHMMGLIFKSGACYFADLQTESAAFMLGSYAAQEKIFKAVYKSDEGKGIISYADCMEQAIQAMAEKKHDLAVLLNAPKPENLWEAASSGRRIPVRTAEFPPAIPSDLIRLKI